jgi:hypothetical protein
MQKIYICPATPPGPVAFVICAVLLGNRSLGNVGNLISVAPPDLTCFDPVR